jgi:hypothetical protein
VGHVGIGRYVVGWERVDDGKGSGARRCHFSVGIGARKLAYAGTKNAVSIQASNYQQNQPDLKS